MRLCCGPESGTVSSYPLRLNATRNPTLALGMKRSCVTAIARLWRPSVIRAFFAFALFATAETGFSAESLRGLPFSRIYSLEDIGYVPRGSRLNFDAFGRIAVIHDSVYSVLNDTVWLNVVHMDEAGHTPMSEVVNVGGRSYYGGRASWGIAEFGTDGKLHPRPLVPPDPPGWTRTTTFDDLIVTADGAYFASRNGVVFFNEAKKQSYLFEVPRIMKIFALGNRVFVSAPGQPLRYIDPQDQSLQPASTNALDGRIVLQATALDDQRVLIAGPDGNLAVFDGVTAAAWPETGPIVRGRITALQRLVDGNIAMAVSGKGLFLLSPEGKPLLSLTAPQYRQILSVASRERGVLWLLTEDSVEKILYEGGLTSFGQRTGLALGWPTVASWNGRIFVASQGVLYETKSNESEPTAHFEAVDRPPGGGVTALTAWGSHMLIGNGTDVYSMLPGGGSQRVGQVRDLAQLVLVNENLCYALGRSEIALFEWNGERWFEPVPRVAGLRAIFNTYHVGQSVWIEMGGDGVARISHKDGELHVMKLSNESWTKALWVNISYVGDIAVLNSFHDKRRFFDEKTENWVEQPWLSKLLDRGPNWLARIWKDENGALWATHNEGLVRFTPNAAGDYTLDLSTFDLINDRYPIVQLLPGSGSSDIWVSASRSLHHVEQVPYANSGPAAEPVLVSVMDSRTNTELLPKNFPREPVRLSFGQNNLTFRFFSGSYTARRAPLYEYRLNPNDPWVTLDSGSLLRITNLHEGPYRLQARLAVDPAVPGSPMTFAFEVLPPWHRTWPAYSLYALVLVLVVTGITRWSGHLARKRNRALEKVVRERTRELETTMQKLNEETRVTATLAERDRLAGEIHDSVQQGLSGAIIQLDTTMKLPSIRGDLLTRLSVVRNMVSYARQEVQHAVWDMDSPLLESNDLGGALRKLTTFTTSSTLMPSVTVRGTPIPLQRFATHHLLRIAQEATTNAVRHAAAQRIEITLDYQDDFVALTVSDDGIGFSVDHVLTRLGHFGLRGMRSRAKKLKGELTVRSARGEGTTISVLMPLNSQGAISSHAEAAASIY
jgi:signal transduction histidine kinase